METPQQDPPSYKIVLLGDSSVGKTSLVHRFINNRFDTDIPNTIGAAFITKDYTSNGAPIKFEIWDTAGQERYRSLTPMYYRNARLALICFDMSNLLSFDRAKYWIDQLELVKENHDIAIKLVGNKTDLVPESIDIGVVDDFVREKSFSFYKTSAKLGDGITQLFDDIANEVDDKFFHDYYASKQSPQRGHSIRLNSLGELSSSCC
jgi:Rab family protein